MFFDDKPVSPGLKEDRIRFIHNAVESALTLGDFQKEVNSECTPENFAREALKRVASIVSFDSSAIYLVDEQTSDLQRAAHTPAESADPLEDEFEFMLDNGFVAWALREKRGLTLSSKDRSRNVLLHVMATYSRIKGLFMGIFPSHRPQIQEAALEMVTIILRNASNGIESLAYSSMIRKQQQESEKEVQRKTRQLVHYEKQLVLAQKMEAIAALAGGVAHQFNNALQGLMGNVDLLSIIAQNDAKILPHIERTRPIIERMANLTNQLTAYARGGTFIASQVISLEALLNEMLPAIKRCLKETVELNVELSDEWVTVDVDLIQIRTAIVAIVTNADEAIIDNGLIQIRSRKLQWSQLPENIKSDLNPGDHARIDFQDNGTGMDDDTLRRLFEPFYSTKFEGRGLSMAAVSGIIKQHNGWIDVTSQLGRGTLAQIYLPIVG